MAASDDHDPRWWTAARKIGATIIGIPTFLGAVGTIFSWSLPAVAAAAVVIVIVAACLLPTRLTNRIAFGLIGVLVVVFVAGLVVGARHSRERPRFSAGARENVTAKQRTEPRRPLRVDTAATQLLPADNAIMAVSGLHTVAQLQVQSFSQLGPTLVSKAPIRHLAHCANRVLATFGNGSISAIDRDQMRFGKVLVYGTPVPSEHLGEMACGDDGSIYVAMPAEAQVIQLTIEPLAVKREISVGQEVTALAFTNHTLYVADADRAAIITVNPDGVPWRWIATAQAPDRLLPLRDGSVLVTHKGSPCLGLAMEGVSQEQGASWSVRGSVIASAVGPEFGVVIDSEGFAYRFDAGGGALVSRPMRVAGASAATTASVLANGHVLVSTGANHQVTDVGPDLWRGLGHYRPRVANGCLPAS